MNISAMMKQAQKMQEKIVQVQEELAGRNVEGSAGGGMVTVVANGKQEIVSVNLASEVFDGQERHMLEDLIVAAVNQSLRASKDLMQQELAKITGGLNIPGITG